MQWAPDQPRILTQEWPVAGIITNIIAIQSFLPENWSMRGNNKYIRICFGCANSYLAVGHFTSISQPRREFWSYKKSNSKIFFELIVMSATMERLGHTESIRPRSGSWELICKEAPLQLHVEAVINFHPSSTRFHTKYRCAFWDILSQCEVSYRSAVQRIKEHGICQCVT